MKKNSFVLMSLLTCVALYSSAASAVITSKPTVGDHRLHLVRYSPNDVIKYVGHYGYQSAIVLEEGETVSTISMGDTISWMINPLGNRIFLKPLEQDATTNMTLITNKRIYYFVLYAEEAEDIDDPKLVFEFKFVYDDQESGNNGFIMGGTERMDPVPYPDLAENPGKYNFNYTIAGPEIIAPLRIFDDGEFTYFEFKDKNADVPAFYTVDSRGQESIINYRVRGDYIVVERVSSVYTLRHGQDVICVFNEVRPFGGVLQGKYSQ